MAFRSREVTASVENETEGTHITDKTDRIGGPTEKGSFLIVSA
jgi:hypothetical protein